MRPTFQNAFLGSLVADALSMPVHWYYDTDALDRDYPKLNRYLAPKKRHPSSILYRSEYHPVNSNAEILHGQAKYWGKKEVHYHQFLEAGENTLNYQLAIELYRLVVRSGGYDSTAWLERYVSRMRNPDWNRDTYVEEVHRGFFTNYARGRDILHCGIDDIHIGAVAQVPALIAALDALGEPQVEDTVEIVKSHVALTHRSAAAIHAAETLTRSLFAIDAGKPIQEVILKDGTDYVSRSRLLQWMRMPDRHIVGEVLTPACYLPDSFTAALFFVWKYQNDFAEGIMANALAGGDNAHRGAVTGALLGAVHGVPEAWLRDLKAMESLRCDTLEPSK